jgi:hypothetical protein
MIQAVQNKLSEETTKAGVAGEETINVNEKTAGSENNGNDNNGGKEE